MHSKHNTHVIGQEYSSWMDERMHDGGEKNSKAFTDEAQDEALQG
jgi:hypothetical protein